MSKLNQQSSSNSMPDISPVSTDKPSDLKYKQNRKVKASEDTSRSDDTECGREKCVMDCLFKLSPAYLCLVDMDGRFRRINSTLEDVLGYSNSTLRREPFLDLVHPDDRTATMNQVEKLRRGINSVNFDNRYRCKNGSYIWLSRTAFLVIQKKMFFCVVRSMTDYIHAQQTMEDYAVELQSTVDRLNSLQEHEQQVLSSIPSIFIGIRDDGRVSHWNRAAENILGLSAAEVVDKPFFSLKIEWPWDQLKNSIDLCLAENRLVRCDELLLKKPSGQDRILGLTVNHIQAESGGRKGLVLVGADITDRKHMESQLVLAQKMESLGALAAGIAHEINTPTQYVGDNIRFLHDAFEDMRNLLNLHERLLESAKENSVNAELVSEVEAAREESDVEFLLEEVPKAIAQSQEGMDRVATIVRAMKEFSHPGREDKALTDLNKAIESTVTISRNEWKYVSELHMDLAPDLPAVPCIMGEFNQVVLNLIVNAAQAIALKVGDGSADKGEICVSTHKLDNAAEIRVSDTGGGIPEDIKAKIFDPFFTTKEVGKGTGQGLALAHNIIVNKHGGSINVETEVGKGTTFILRLPTDRDNA